MKYSAEQLKTMAKTVLQADSYGDERAFMLWMAMSLRTGLSPDEVKRRVQDLAK